MPCELMTRVMGVCRALYMTGVRGFICCVAQDEITVHVIVCVCVGLCERVHASRLWIVRNFTSTFRGIFAMMATSGESPSCSKKKGVSAGVFLIYFPMLIIDCVALE